MTQLGNHRLTTREVASLYASWRGGDAEQKERIANAPLLFLRAVDPRKELASDDETSRLAGALDIASKAVWRARSDFERAIGVDKTAPENKRVRRAFGLLGAAYDALRGKVDEHAGSGHANGHLEATG